MATVMVRASQTVRRRRSRMLFEITGWIIANRHPHDRQRAERLGLKYGHQRDIS
jgi:predicted component of type VI protein secretion system